MQQPSGFKTLIEGAPVCANLRLAVVQKILELSSPSFSAESFLGSDQKRCLMVDHAGATGVGIATEFPLPKEWLDLGRKALANLKVIHHLTFRSAKIGQLEFSPAAECEFGLEVAASDLLTLLEPFD